MLKISLTRKIMKKFMATMCRAQISMVVFVSNSKSFTMSFQKIKPGTATLLLIIVLVGIIRVIFNFNYDISPIANFSPLGAMAIFGGAYFDRRWKAFLFPLLTLFISDFILHQTVFKSYGNGVLYGGWYWVYSAFLLMTLAGRWIMKRISVMSFL